MLYYIRITQKTFKNKDYWVPDPEFWIQQSGAIKLTFLRSSQLTFMLLTQRPYFEHYLSLKTKGRSTELRCFDITCVILEKVFTIPGLLFYLFQIKVRVQVIALFLCFTKIYKYKSRATKEHTMPLIRVIQRSYRRQRFENTLQRSFFLHFGFLCQGN